MMRLVPQVSVIIPVYNAQPYIDKCMDSLLGQTLDELEVIAVNDGSTDGTAAKLSNWCAKDARVRVLSQSHSGAAAARNRGLSLASAPYIAFIDADDWVDTGIYQVAAEKMDETGVDAVVWGLTVPIFDRKGWIVGYKGDTSPMFSMEGLYPAMESVGACPQSSANLKLYRRSMIEANSVSFPTEPRNGEDLAFWWKYAVNADRLYFLPGFRYYYRDNPRSLTHDRSGQIGDGFAHDSLISARDAVAYCLGQRRPDPSLIWYVDSIFFQALRNGAAFLEDPDDGSFRCHALSLITELGLGASGHAGIASFVAGGGLIPPKFKGIENFFSIKNTREKKLMRLFGHTFTLCKRKIGI